MAKRDVGGLGIGSIRAKNLALIGKWRWCFLIEDNSLWSKIIKHIYGSDGGFENHGGSGLRKGIWDGIVSCSKKIDNLNVPFSTSFHRKVANGRNTYFWNHTWLVTSQPLRILFPRLYALEINKNCKVSERWCWDNDTWRDVWTWRTRPRGRSESEF